MIQVRPSGERGHFDFGWLNTFHSFSFGDYYDPKFMGFRTLRVINEDFVKPGEGFGTHGHKDMEIVTYVLSGELAHKDSMGNGSSIKPGEVQYMSAGSGVQHSEFNHDAKGTTHLLQIWILPNEKGATPRYDQRHFEKEDRQGKLQLLVSPDGAENSIAIRQDAKLFAAIAKPGEEIRHSIQKDRHVWLQVITGEISVLGKTLSAGDGAAISDEASIVLKPQNESEFLLFDMA